MDVVSYNNMVYLFTKVVFSLVQQKKKKKETSSGSGGGGGDLMSDLASMLTMRRRGIAGSGGAGKSAPAEESKPVEAPPVGVMNTMSSMIPYSPMDNSADQDDDDWNE
ncbi:hypothetical protein EB796_004115 [Bugula neritina]|uniref:Uncharacterized protein n=1 Tax=Bugula neritina TaxID=10212 RepID=A0A7J7KI55_BUGNE|nr:hypothetical protein EB796_004115 [Bugula neritina]